MTKTSELWISPTQDETFQLCNRKWWFGWVLKLTRPQQTFQAFGTATHEVCERYLLADETGRDLKTGEPVDLYPEGWHVVTERDGQVSELTLAEQAQIQRLVAKAVEGGVLVREPGGVVEHKMHRPLCDIEGVPVFVSGKVDYLLPGKVIDHKTTKAMKWAKSPKKLAANPQMLTYAREVIFRAEERGEPTPDIITLQHNVFCKDPSDPRVRKTVVDVSSDDVLAYWSRLQRQAQEMLRVSRIQEWFNVPEPENLASACNAYGGCEFRSICGGRESIERYLSRMRRLTKSQESGSIEEPQSSTTRSTVQVDLAERLKRARERGVGSQTPPAGDPQVNSGAPKPAPSSKPPQFPQAAPEAPESPVWAWADCTACEGRGFNTKGSPCRICDAHASEQGGLTSAAFSVAVVGSRIVWEPKAGVDAAGGEASVPGQGEAVTAETRTAPPEPVREPVREPVQELVREPVREGPEETPEVELSKVPGAKGRGRPKKGYTLVIGASVMKKGGSSKLFFLEDVFRETTEHLRDQVGKESWYDIDAFRRRDMLARNAEILAEGFGTALVICNCRSTDERHFVDQLRQFAAVIIEGNSG